MPSLSKAAGLKTWEQDAALVGSDFTDRPKVARIVHSRTVSVLCSLIVILNKRTLRSEGSGEPRVAAHSFY
jgi:hypothetical protein